MLRKDQNIFRIKYLEECLIIEFRYDETKREVLLVAVVSPNTLPKLSEELKDELAKPHDREFARFRFFGVSDFIIRNGAKPFASQFGFSGKDKDTTCIYGIRISNWKGRIKFEACFSSFGDVEFTFGNVDFFSKLSRLATKDDEVNYHDLTSNELIDFCNPFPGVDN